MKNNIDRKSIREGRHIRVRNRIHGTAERPRLSVFRSSKHIYVQIIDDVKQTTIVAASTVEKDIAEHVASMSKVEAAKYVGEIAGKRALEKGISTIVFDRGGFLYTGRGAAVADGAREAGLVF
jgi:large subunit ribosomal protein L18